MHDLESHSKVKTINTFNNTIKFISNLETLISNSSITELTSATLHGPQLNDLYISLLNNLFLTNTELSQPRLIHIVETIIEQNKRIGVDLDVSFWNHLFSIYYKLPQPIHEEYNVIQLLATMGLYGSNAVPNIATFKIIISGIFNVMPQDNTRHLLLKCIYQWMKRIDYNDINTSLQLQFWFHIQTRNTVHLLFMM